MYAFASAPRLDAKSEHYITAGCRRSWWARFLGPLWEGAVGEADWGREILTLSLPPSRLRRATSLAEGGKDGGYDNPSVNASRCHLSYASPHNPV